METAHEPIFKKPGRRMGPNRPGPRVAGSPPASRSRQPTLSDSKIPPRLGRLGPSSCVPCMRLSDGERGSDLLRQHFTAALLAASVAIASHKIEFVLAVVRAWSKLLDFPRLVFRECSRLHSVANRLVDRKCRRHRTHSAQHSHDQPLCTLTSQVRRSYATGRRIRGAELPAGRFT